jgi:dTDP-4-dehydrorhamnose reductase
MYPEISILIIGSSGFLGRSLAAVFSPQAQVFGTHYQHPTFSDSLPYNVFQDDVRPLLDRAKISTVVFTALIEMETPEKVRPAMERFVRGCRDCRLVYLSSDGIFDGTRGNYAEQDEPTPCTQYGNNLLFCETLVKELCSNYCIIRPSYIYGFSAGQLDPRLSYTRNKLRLGEAVELFEDMYKSPLGVQQVAKAVATLSLSDYTGTLHVSGERMSVFDFHHQAMHALGVDTAGLTRCAMPTAPGFLRDTSLDSALWQSITGTRPLSVQETVSPRHEGFSLFSV